MKRTIYAITMILLLGCGKSFDTSSSSDSTQIASDSISTEESALSEEENKWAQNLDRFMEDLNYLKSEYPFVGFSYHNEVVSHQVRYYFSEDQLNWVHVYHSEEGGIAESYIVNRDPEGTFYLHYGTEIDGAFGYVGMTGGEWYKVKPDGDYKPHVVGAGVADEFDYQTDFEKTIKKVRENMNKFSLKGATYSYEEAGDINKNTYEFSEVLFTSNLLSSTRFNPETIKSYLNWWYPLYESTNGDYYRHVVCTGGEDYIKIIEEANNYRWEEETSGKTTAYTIKSFEESEGDAFYATLERNGTQVKKTLILNEDEGLMIDGHLYTSNPKRYDSIHTKCD